MTKPAPARPPPPSLPPADIPDTPCRGGKRASATKEPAAAQAQRSRTGTSPATAKHLAPQKRRRHEATFGLSAHREPRRAPPQEPPKMSEALLRRNSSKQGLQNLIRLTAQRSVEDAEEVERERRRRAREDVCRGKCDAAPAGHVADRAHDDRAHDDHAFDGVQAKPGGSPSLEEDEGFSDWTQRREMRRQQRLLEVAGGGRDRAEEERNSATLEGTSAGSGASRSTRVRRDDEDEDGETAESDDASQVEERQQTQMSYMSEVFLLRDPEPDADAAQQEVTLQPSNQSKSRSPGYMLTCETLTTSALELARLSSVRYVRCGEAEKIRRGLLEEESQELEQLRRRHAQAERELDELGGGRELRRRLRSDEERRRQDDQRQRVAKEEEARRRTERRRRDAAERVKSSSDDGGAEAFGPIKTPTHKITERTESLNRSLKKSNSFKKTPALVLASNIDDKMEQYAHAVENSQEPRGSKASVADLPNSLEAVTSKKSLFEAGEAWTSSPPKTTSCRDADGLKVGVANLITQWVKGQPDGGRPPQSRAADVKCGDVMQKKNMWEVIGDSSGRSAANTKGSGAVSKKFKFVVTGHGKYEKISVDQEHAMNGKSDFCPRDY
ncbi:non-muscle caldesmon isoform X2 [Phyllopteryx taeniolatus]|uniref:non-muscle caldesmon isoform X2 n=1 Tax=Phyllopteryx taeniolatus TaxID=161469 RepID=UPI002AD5983E|nr:non-muscle caldesmon isoform X2 [Phyllopteryx taeniolatus]